MAFAGLTDEALLEAAEKAQEKARRLRVAAMEWDEQSAVYLQELAWRRAAEESRESELP